MSFSMSPSRIDEDIFAFIVALPLGSDRYLKITSASLRLHRGDKLDQNIRCTLPSQHVHWFRKKEKITRGQGGLTIIAIRRRRMPSHWDALASIIHD